ncbi:hypothetical protein Tco_0789849 [Tanacetum coccineum]
MFGEGSTVKSHYAIVKALALDEDAMPEIVDEIVPKEGMFSQGLLKHWRFQLLSMEKTPMKTNTENLVAYGKGNNASKKSFPQVVEFFPHFVYLGLGGCLHKVDEDIEGEVRLKFSLLLAAKHRMNQFVNKLYQYLCVSLLSTIRGGIFVMVWWGKLCNIPISVNPRHEGERGNRGFKGGGGGAVELGVWECGTCDLGAFGAGGILGVVWGVDRGGECGAGGGVSGFMGILGLICTFYRKGYKGQKEANSVKNRQETKETRKRVKKQPKIKAGSADTARKAKIMKPRTENDKSSKFKSSFGVIKFKGLSLTNVESCLVKKKKEEGKHKGQS